MWNFCGAKLRTPKIGGPVRPNRPTSNMLKAGPERKKKIQQFFSSRHQMLQSLMTDFHCVHA